MPRYNDWIRRSNASVGGVPLGHAGELWRVVPKSPANEWVLERAAMLGRTYDDANIAFYTSRTQLDDVLHAAGAIEYTVGRIETTVAAVQSYAETHDVKARSAEVPMHLVTSEVNDAYIEYANLLNWLRTLSDRMRSTDPHSGAKLGLIPALNPAMPLRPDVETIFDRFERDALIVDEAELTNFGLHLHALPGGGTPRATMDSDGVARLLIPDKPSERVYLFDQFTYDDERDLLQFARAVNQRVAVFVDELLTAFEKGTAHAMSQRDDERSD